MWSSRYLPSYWQNMKTDKNKLTAIQEEVLFCGYSPCFEDFFILKTDSDDFKLKIMESLLIEQDKPLLSNGDTSILLKLFWWSTLVIYHIIWYSSASCVYIIVVCPVFNIMLQIQMVLSKKLKWPISTIIGVTMTTSAFKSQPNNTRIFLINCDYSLIDLV